MDNILFHIGYHKTGTTWLQNEVFTSDNDYFFPLSKKKNGHSSIAAHFIQDGAGYLLNSFDNNEEAIKNDLDHIIGQSTDFKYKVPVVSHERLSGNPHSSGFDSAIIARRIKNVFPNAKIFIVIREQSSWILSNYFQYLSIGGTHGIKKYLETIYDGKRPGFSPSHLKYHFLINDYQEKFGKENVLVLTFEQFKSNKKGFLTELGNFVEKEIRIHKTSDLEKRYNTKANHYINYKFRFLNSFIHSSSVNNHSGLTNRWSRKSALLIKKLLSYFISSKSDEKIQEQLKQKIKKWSTNKFEESNTITQNMTGLNLQALNYATVDAQS